MEVGKKDGFLYTVSGCGEDVKWWRLKGTEAIVQKS